MSRPRTLILGSLRSAHTLYAIIATLAVAYFVVAVPAGFGLDEQSHVNRAYQISQGQPIPELRADGRSYGGEIPDKLQRFDMLGWDWGNHVAHGAPFYERQDFRDADVYEHLGSQVVRPGDPTTSIDFTNAGASSFVPYLPSAVGMKVALVANADVHTVMLLGRIVNGAVAIALTAIGIWLLRRSPTKWLFMTVGLLPSVLFLNSYTTADSYTTAIVTVFVAAVVRLCSEPRPSWPFLVGTAVAGLGVVAAKPTYVVLLAIVLLVPLARWLRRRALGTAPASRRETLRDFGLAAGYLVVSLVPTFVLLRSTSAIAGAIRLQRQDWQSIEPSGQLHALVAHPMSLVGVFVRTTALSGRDWTYSLVGSFGYNTIDLVQPALTVAIIAVVLGAVVAQRVPRIVALGMVVVALATAIAVVVALYLTFTPVGAAVVDGVQGRYFAPVIALLGVGLGSLLPIRATIGDRAAAVLFTVLGVVPVATAVLQWQATVY